jgi:hypothetical protein
MHVTMKHARRTGLAVALGVLLGAALGAQQTGGDGAGFEGAYVSGAGDVEYLQLLDTSARVLHPDPEYQDIGMLYNSGWNGFVEGPTWGAWWIQNSYGPSYCALPFLVEPYVTFLRNAQELWFSQMGDGKRAGARDWVAPDGCLCDAASPGWIYYKQGDGRLDIHDWGMEFTAAGIVLQAELLLIGRDRAACERSVPQLERCAEFIESRRDPAKNLFLAGPAGNLLAPSHAGWKKPDGTYDKSYLTGLSVTYIAGLDRLIELERFLGRTDAVARYEQRRDLARAGLQAVTTEEGYLIKSLDPDGTRHGVYGAPKHGYFEAVCNHDAIAFRVVDDTQANAIYRKIAAIPGLRPHDVILTNYPSLDDMYEQPAGLWGFGTWVNGGHWTTCEARMILAYYRLGKYEDARRSMQHILEFYRQFRTDNPLVECGAKPYQPKEPINCVYDTWGAPTAMLRGLFEYLYRADGLTLVPHIPPGITRLDQRFPVRLGEARIFLSTRGQGPITAVWLNAAPWKHFDATTVTLPAAEIPAVARVVVCLGGARPEPAAPSALPAAPIPPPGDAFWTVRGYLPVDNGNLRPLRFGADSNANNRFLGLFRRARLFPVELTATEVAALARDAAAEPAADRRPLVDYVLDAAVDGTVANRASSDFPAKIVGELTFEATPQGQAARFTGKGYLETAFEPRLNLPGAYTLDVWICPDQLPEAGVRLIDKVTAGVDDGYLLDTFPGNSLRLITEMGHATHAAQLVPGQWVHVAATFNPAGQLRLYLSGKEVAATAAAKPRPAWEGIGVFCDRLSREGEGDSYEARHARLIVDYLSAVHERQRLKAARLLPPLPPASQLAADKSYLEAAERLAQGLQTLLRSYQTSKDPRQAKLAALWTECNAPR